MRDDGSGLAVFHVADRQERPVMMVASVRLRDRLIGCSQGPNLSKLMSCSPAILNEEHFDGKQNIS